MFRLSLLDEPSPGVVLGNRSQLGHGHLLDHFRWGSYRAVFRVYFLLRTKSEHLNSGCSSLHLHLPFFGIIFCFEFSFQVRQGNLVAQIRRH